MPCGDPPPMPWSDAHGYLPLWAVQEPLGRDFERILYDNIWGLYSRSYEPEQIKSALWFWD